MVWCFILVTILLFISCTHLYELRKELQHMREQLECVQEGSHIVLSTQLKDAAVMEVYRLLNEIRKDQERTKLLYEASEKELRDTITSLAHDLRTPLTSAMGYLQMLETCDSEQKRQEYTDISLKRLHDLHQLLESLFLYTKVIHHDGIQEQEDIYLYPILSDCMISLYQNFMDKEMDVQVDFDDEKMQAFASKESIQRIFMNLLTNAYQHGERFLSITQRGRTICFRNGLQALAIPDPDAMFQRFYKGDPARHMTSSGLGLSIVSELMGQLHSHVYARIEGLELEICLDFEERSRS